MHGLGGGLGGAAGMHGVGIGGAAGMHGAGGSLGRAGMHGIGEGLGHGPAMVRPLRARGAQISLVGGRC